MSVLLTGYATTVKDVRTLMDPTNVLAIRATILSMQRKINAKVSLSKILPKKENLPYVHVCSYCCFLPDPSYVERIRSTTTALWIQFRFQKYRSLKKIFKRLVLVQYWSLNPQTYTAAGGGGEGGEGRRGWRYWRARGGWPSKVFQSFFPRG